MKKKILIIVTCVVALSNTPPISYVFKFFLNEGLYKYADISGRFQSGERKSFVYEGVKRNFEIYKQENPDQKNTILYRCFTKNPLTFWRYGDYLFDERYKLPYMALPDAGLKRKR